MLPAKKAITECLAQGGDGAGLSVAPGASQSHGTAVLSASVSPSVRGGSRSCRQPGASHRVSPGAGPHKILGLFSNLKSNLALPPRPGLAAVMNELSGSRRHAPPPAASLSHGPQPPEAPSASTRGTGEGTHPTDATSRAVPCPGGPGHRRQGAVLASRCEGSVGRSRQGMQVGAGVAAWEPGHCRDAGGRGWADAGAHRWCEGAGRGGWARAAPLAPRRTTGTQRGDLAPVLASVSCCPMAASTLAPPASPDAHGQAESARAAGAGTQGAAPVPGDPGGDRGRQPWQPSEELGFNIHGSAGGEAFDLVCFAILLELNSHLPADTCHITAPGSLEHRAGRAPAETPSTAGTGRARGQSPAGSSVPMPGVCLPSHPVDSSGALVPSSPPTAHVIPLPRSPCGANGFLQQFPCAPAAVINCMSAAISDPSAVRCHVPPLSVADSTQISPSSPFPRISVMDTPLVGSTHSVSPHSGHDEGARPRGGSVQALLCPRTRQSSPLWVLAVPAPSQAGRAGPRCPPSSLPFPLPTARDCH